jgi:Ca-activated chloride channel homolog
MRPPRVLNGLLLLMLLYRFDARTTAAAEQDEPTYNLRVDVDEVVLTFHASAADGTRISDLKLGEIRLLDSGKPPAKIIDFQSFQDLPIRAGILLDNSDSMQGHLSGNRTIATQYAQQVLQQHADQGFVMNFARVSSLSQTLTSDPVALVAAVRKVPQQGPSGMRGTAIFDAIFRACLYEFGKGDRSASGNFLLLFSDGVDNASYVTLKDAVDRCQRRNTAIYVFRVEPKSGEGSTGPSTLAELAEETGGRVFHGRDSADQVAADLSTIEADLRDQYRLVYKPADLKHDGAFHHIALIGPERVAHINARSGYYAPGR